MPLHIKITGKKISYDITLKSRYTIVVGCSGTGKTKLVDLLTYRKIRPGYEFEISDPKYMFMCAASFDVMRMPSRFENLPMVCLLDDEDMEYDEKVQYFIANCTDVYFVFFTRNEHILNLDYRFFDVCKMVMVDGYNTLAPAYPEHIRSEQDLRNYYANERRL